MTEEEVHDAPHIDQLAKLELEAIYFMLEDYRVGLRPAILLREFLDSVHVIPVHSKEIEDAS